MASLDELGIGKSGRVMQMNLPPTDGQRLTEMGLTLGATVKMLRCAPLGDPLEIVVRGYHLSLRKAEARGIMVEPVP